MYLNIRILCMHIGKGVFINEVLVYTSEELKLRGIHIMYIRTYIHTVYAMVLSKG